MDNIWQSQLQPFSFFVHNSVEEDLYGVDDAEYGGFPDICGDLIDLVDGIDYHNDEEQKVKTAVNHINVNLSYVCGSEGNKEKLRLKENFETGCSSRKEKDLYKSLSIDIPELQLPEDPWDGLWVSTPNGVEFCSSHGSTLDSDSPVNCDLETPTDVDFYHCGTQPWDGLWSQMTSSPNGAGSTLDSDSPVNWDLDTLDTALFVVDDDMDDDPPFTQPPSECICQKKDVQAASAVK